MSGTVKLNSDYSVVRKIIDDAAVIGAAAEVTTLASVTQAVNSSLPYSYRPKKAYSNGLPVAFPKNRRRSPIPIGDIIFNGKQTIYLTDDGRSTVRDIFLYMKLSPLVEKASGSPYPLWQHAFYERGISSFFSTITFANGDLTGHAIDSRLALAPMLMFTSDNTERTFLENFGGDLPVLRPTKPIGATFKDRRDFQYNGGVMKLNLKHIIGDAIHNLPTKAESMSMRLITTLAKESDFYYLGDGYPEASFSILEMGIEYEFTSELGGKSYANALADYRTVSIPRPIRMPIRHEIYVKESTGGTVTLQSEDLLVGGCSTALIIFMHQDYMLPGKSLMWDGDKNPKIKSFMFKNAGNVIYPEAQHNGYLLTDYNRDMEQNRTDGPAMNQFRNVLMLNYQESSNGLDTVKPQFTGFLNELNDNISLEFTFESNLTSRPVCHLVSIHNALAVLSSNSFDVKYNAEYAFTKDMILRQ